MSDHAHTCVDTDSKDPHWCEKLRLYTLFWHHKNKTTHSSQSCAVFLHLSVKGCNPSTSVLHNPWKTGLPCWCHGCTPLNGHQEKLTEASSSEVNGESFFRLLLCDIWNNENVEILKAQKYLVWKEQLHSDHFTKPIKDIKISSLFFRNLARIISLSLLGDLFSQNRLS